MTIKGLRIRIRIALYALIAGSVIATLGLKLPFMGLFLGCLALFIWVSLRIKPFEVWLVMKFHRGRPAAPRARHAPTDAEIVRSRD